MASIKKDSAFQSRSVKPVPGVILKFRQPMQTLSGGDCPPPLQAYTKLQPAFPHHSGLKALHDAVGALKLRFRVGDPPPRLPGLSGNPPRFASGSEIRMCANFLNKGA